MLIGAWLRRLQLLVRRDRATAELEEEMRLHRELRAESLQSLGRNPEEARNLARRRFGNPLAIQEQSRDHWGFPLIDDLRQDIRYAVRRLLQRPGYTLSVVVVLALGIGATTAMFSAVDAAMLRPLPFARPQELLSLNDITFPYDLTYSPGRHDAPKGIRSRNVTVADVQSMHSVFSHAAAYAAGEIDLRDASHPTRVRVGEVTPDLFATLGIAPLQGRAFTAQEGAPSGPAAVILSYSFWQRQYAGRVMLNEVIRLGGQSYTVVGIMPRNFAFPEGSDLWIPLVLPMSPDVAVPLRGIPPSHVVARVAPGQTLASAAQQLLLRWRQELSPPGLAKIDPDVAEQLKQLRVEAVAVPLQKALVGDRRAALLLLFGATAILLLISCTNMASLVLSQAAARRREAAVREVLGATRRRVIRQLLTESVLLSLVGAAVGSGLARILVGALKPLLPTSVAALVSPQLDMRVLGLAVSLAIIAGLGAGIWPALRSTTASPNATIKSGGYLGSHANARRGRRLLVSAQVMLTVLLMVGAGLLLRSARALDAVDRGMQLSSVGSLDLALPVLPTPHFNWDTVRDFSQLKDIWGLQRQRTSINEMLRQLVQTPGIDAASFVDEVPLGGSAGSLDTRDIFVDGTFDHESKAPEGADRKLVREHWISGSYFSTMGIPLLAGRTFTEADDSLSESVAVVSQGVARRYVPGASPIGKTFHLGVRDNKPVTIVGVVGNVSERGIDIDTFPQIYTPVAQAKIRPYLAFVARGHLTPHDLLIAMQAAIHRAEPSQPVYHVRMMTDVVRAATEQRRANTLLSIVFATLALTLSIFGTYAVVASGVSGRRRELGIRSALGASGAALARLIAQEMVLVLGAGVMLGVLLAWALARLTGSLVYGVTVHDPLTFTAAPLLVLAAAAVATTIPARRTLRINPAEVMRAD